MTYIEFINKEGEQDKYFLHHKLAENLQGVSKLINKEDRDFVLVIDGPEGYGKSTLACQAAKCVDPTFTQERMCLNPQEFIDAINKAKKGQAVVYDEAYGGLGSSSVLSPINKLLTGMMMEMRKKNLFVILVLPSFFYLSKYGALHRAEALLHVYRKGGFVSYPKEKMKLLYLTGKRKMSYSYPKIYFYQNFQKKIPIDWETYENRKIESLKQRKGDKERVYSPTTVAVHERHKLQRNILLRKLHEKFNLTYKEIQNLLVEEGENLSQPQISIAMNNSKKI